MPNQLQKIIVGLFTGVEFAVRKVSMANYIQEMADFPFAIDAQIISDLQKFNDTIRQLPPTDKKRANDKVSKLFWSYGIAELKYPDQEQWTKPNIWYEDEAQCPENWVLLKDFGSDVDLIASQIAEYSFSIRRTQANAAFFSESGSGITGPSGDEIRPEAVIPTTNGNGE